jgi:hypothetical protein
MTPDYELRGAANVMHITELHISRALPSSLAEPLARRVNEDPPEFLMLAEPGRSGGKRRLITARLRGAPAG